MAIWIKGVVSVNEDVVADLEFGVQWHLNKNGSWAADVWDSLAGTKPIADSLCTC